MKKIYFFDKYSSELLYHILNYLNRITIKMVIIVFVVIATSKPLFYKANKIAKFQTTQPSIFEYKNPFIHSEKSNYKFEIIKNNFSENKNLLNIRSIQISRNEIQKFSENLIKHFNHEHHQINLNGVNQKKEILFVNFIFESLLNSAYTFYKSKNLEYTLLTRPPPIS